MLFCEYVPLNADIGNFGCLSSNWLATRFSVEFCAAPFTIDSVDTSTIVILDFGSQYTQLIARRIREFNVFSVVLPCTAPIEQIRALAPLGLILSGGPSSVYDADAPAADPALLTMGVPILGICYGLQFIVHHLGGRVEPAPAREYGHAEVEIVAGSERSLLGTGDSVFFQADVPHSYRNAGSSKAVMFLVMTYTTMIG